MQRGARAAIASVFLSALVVCMLPPVSASAAEEIALPTRADLHLASLQPPVPGSFPPRIPRSGGTISANEIVRVGLRDDGTVNDITVDQTIQIGGVGDYSLEITGPATEIEVLPGSDARAGLRNGAVIWEGFCPGERTLRARATMDVTAFRFTPLPLTITRSGGRV